MPDLSTLSTEDLLRMRDQAAAALPAMSSLADMSTDDLKRMRRQSFGIDFAAPDDQIRSAIAALPESDRQGAMDAWADDFVERENAAGGVGQALSNTVRTLARGTPVGSWLDEANAATSYALSGFDPAAYDESKAYNDARDRFVDDKYPKLSLAGQLAGGLASVAALPLPSMGGAGSTLLGRTATSAAGGAGAGAVYGAGLGQGGIGERLDDAASGAIVGGALGALAPAFAQGAGKAAGYLGEKLTKPVPREVQAYGRGALNRIVGGMTDDGLMRAGVAESRGRVLGPEGMLADFGPNVKAHTEAIASIPGRGQTIVEKVLQDRSTTAPARIRGEVDQALGGKVNVPRMLDAIETNFKNRAKPLYDRFRATPVPYTQELQDVVEQIGNRPSVLRHAREMADLDVKGGARQFFARILDDGSVKVDRVPNATELDYLKRALDRMARGSDPTDQYVFGELAKKLRNTVDEILSPGDPGNSIWAQARAVHSDRKGIEEAFAAGRKALSRGVSPDQMAYDMRGMSAAEQAAFKAAARSSVSDVMGNAATAFGPNGDTAARRALGSEYGREKLALLAGKRKAGRLSHELDVETTFAETARDVLGNSRTAKRTAAQKLYPAPGGASGQAQNLRQGSLTGYAVEGLYRLANAMTGGMISASRDQIAADAAAMLTAKGMTRDQIIKGLTAYGQGKAMTKTQEKLVEKYVGGILRGMQPAAIGATGG